MSMRVAIQSWMPRGVCSDSHRFASVNSLGIGLIRAATGSVTPRHLSAAAVVSGDAIENREGGVTVQTHVG
jgi:hypothetical protein